MKKKSIVRNAAFLFFVALFILSASYVGQDITEYHSVRDKAIRVEQEVKRDKAIDWQKLWKINPDIVAWIEIPDTAVDYPVVQTPNNNEYLYKDIDGGYSQYGAIFLDQRLCRTKLKENPNNIIYGHNMGRWTDVMFGGLKSYLDSNYLKGHENVILYTPEETYHYQIASVMHTTSVSSVYYAQENFRNILFADWVKEQTQKSMYQCLTDDKIQVYTDGFIQGKITKNIQEYGNTLTLSTCDTTHNTDKKIVIFCIPKTE